MNLNLKQLLPSILAVFLLLVVGIQTSSALKSSGAWRQRKVSVAKPDPYAFLDQRLAAAADSMTSIQVRDPFAYGTVAAPVAQATRPRTTRHQEPVRVIRSRPIVTMILADDDPRALITYENRNYTVKIGDLFAEYRVVSINAEQVVLDGGGQRLVLRRPTRGDSN